MSAAAFEHLSPAVSSSVIERAPSEKGSLLERMVAQNVEHRAVIERIKKERGSDLVILGHHYQRKEVVDLSDIVGDSFKLARDGARAEGRTLVFCGVRFMVESCAVLKREDQRVFHPSAQAGCPMADMGDIDDAIRSWAELEAICGAGSLLPITYMNSFADLKAFCGRNGGTVCTSSNAERVFRWAFEQGKRIFFFPDEHLGRNTARKFGLGPRDEVVWDGTLPGGGVDPERVRRARVILWKGYCHVHTHFTVAMVERARTLCPGAKVIVHPECMEEVLAVSDAHGSTEAICRYVEDAGPGSTVVIGTEVNLIDRLARDFSDRRVLALDRSLCPNMYKINLANLRACLEQDILDPSKAVEVPASVRSEARIALERMLAMP
ncbi:MAG: quinolinate synthase NadA [Planctomycetes bacterium]|nr:quinolinate synthase NadA [Planctomycetota bacterium]